MSVKRQLFTTCNARGLELGAEQIGFGLPLILGFSLVPQHSHATALPVRYNIDKGTKSERWHGRQVAWLDKEALSLSPVFQLSRHCSNGLAALQQQAPSVPVSLQQLRSITSHPISVPPSTSGSSSSSSSSISPAAAGYASAAMAAAVAAAGPADAASTAATQTRKQLERQHTATVDDGKLPWLGAELDVAGYTKKGYMRGGGKEQNQDRGLIMQQFRSPQEMLIGVMDGHGTFGHLVSTYIVQHLPAVLMQKLVAAAAALHKCSSDSSTSQDNSGSSRHAGDKHRGNKQQLQSQQMQYVVVPDHSSSINSSCLVTDLHEQQQQQQQVQKGGAQNRRGRLVSRHKVVHQPEHQQSNSNNSSSSGESLPPYQTVPSNLVNHVPLSKGLLQAVFAETDHMLTCSGVNVLDSGSTALVTHIGHDTLTTAWVGDSRAVLGRRLVDADKGLKAPKQHQQQWQQWGGGSGSSSSSSQKWQVIQLSDDHKPERPDEQLRIVMNNGRVEQMQNAAGQGVGPYRVWFKQLDYPGLAMSRAFGDAPCRRIGVTVEPQLYVHRLTADDQVLVAASDGVWEYMTNQEAVELVGRCDDAATAARKLVEAAEQRWQQEERGNYIDDITAVVVRATPRHKHTASKL